MKIQFNTDKTINGDEKHQDYFSNMIAEGLKYYESTISRIEVHLSDDNGNKEGINTMLCMLEARIEGRKPIAVSCNANTIELAVKGSLDKLKTSIEKILGRTQQY